MVPPPCRMLGEEALDRLGPEETCTADRIGRAGFLEERRELAAKPASQRDAEAFLRALEDLARQRARERALEHILGREATELQTHRQAPRQLDDAPGTERHSDPPRSRHARAGQL